MPTHRLVILTKFHGNRTKIVDYSVIVELWSSVNFYYSVSIKDGNWINPNHNLDTFITSLSWKNTWLKTFSKEKNCTNQCNYHYHFYFYHNCRENIWELEGEKAILLCISEDIFYGSYFRLEGQRYRVFDNVKWNLSFVVF